MSTTSFTQGTTALARATLADDNGPVGVSDATVTLLMRPAIGGDEITVDCAPTGAPGEVEWVWPAAVDPVMRVYRAKFQVEFADGTIEFFPSDEFADVIVERPI